MKKKQPLNNSGDPKVLFGSPRQSNQRLLGDSRDKHFYLDAQRAGWRTGY